MTFFENQILQALSMKPNSSSVESPKSVGNFNGERKKDVLYENLASDSVFSLLENLQWKEAIAAMKASPDEVSEWVTKNDKRGMKLIWRRLPIHEACVRKTTPEVIYHLLELYRGSAEAKDNSSRTPLHHAFIHDADINIIYQLVHVYYDALSMPDFWGKTARDYAMLSKSVHKRDIVKMLSQSKEEIELTVRDIEARLLKKLATYQKISAASYSIRTQPNQEELLLQGELEQARIESDIAYTQRDAAMLAQDRFRRKIDDLEKQIALKNTLLEDMDDISNRNKALNSLLTKYEKKNAELLESVDKQTKTIDSLKQENESKIESIMSDMLEKDQQWKHEKDEYKRKQKKMKDTINVLSDKLRRMDSGLDDTISVLENDLSHADIETNERYKSCVEEKVKYLEDLVELYKENLCNSQKYLDQNSNEKDELQNEVQQLMLDVEESSNENEQLQSQVQQLEAEVEDFRNIKYKLEVKVQKLEKEVEESNSMKYEFQSTLMELKDHVKTSNNNQHIGDQITMTNLQGQIKEYKEKIIRLEIECEEYKKEVKVYESCHNMSKERIDSLENLISAYQNGSDELEDELKRAKSSFLHVMDQLVDRTETVGRLEDEIEMLTEKCERMRDTYPIYGTSAHPARSELLTPRELYRTDISHHSSRRDRSRSPGIISRRRKPTRSMSPYMRR